MHPHSTRIPMTSSPFRLTWALAALTLCLQTADAQTSDAWQPIGLVGTRITSLAVGAGDVLFAGTEHDGVHRTTDGGATWQKIFGAHDSIAAVVVNSRGVVFVGSPQSNAVARSRDGVATWQDVGSFATGVTALALHDDGRVYVGAKLISYSSNDGDTWDGYAGFKFPTRIAAMAVNWAWETWAIATVERDLVVRSTGNSNHWDLCALPKGCRSLAITPSMTIFVGTDSGMYRSEDRGDTFTAISTGLTARRVRSVVLGREGLVFAGTADGGVFRSVGKGDLWVPANTGLTDPAVTVLAASPGGSLYAATETGGVFRSTPSLTGVDGDAALPQTLALQQNHPNPFTPSTLLTYATPERGAVRLTVHDAMGREVAVLVDGIVEAGAHTVAWQAGALPAGLYVARLHAGRELRTRTMLLVR